MSRPIARIAHDRAWRRVAWAGSVLLLGVVVFWWGGYVAPHLFSLTFPELLPPRDPTLAALNATNEGTIANTVSAATLAGVALLALAAAVVDHRRSARWMAVGGWTVLAVTTAVLAFEELAEFKSGGPISVAEQAQRLGFRWPVLVSPLAAGFVLAVWLFVHKGLRTRSARAPLLLGIACWVLALVHEAIVPGLFAWRARPLEHVLEETLEFSGTLMIGLSAVIALRGGRPPPRPPFGGRWRTALVGSIAAVALLGGVALVFVFRAPLVEALAPYPRVDAFELRLQRREAVVQEILMPAAPVQSLRLFLANCAPGGRAGTVAVHATPFGMPDLVLAEGSVAVPAADCPGWKEIELLPPLTADEGQRLALQVAVDVDPGAELGVGVTKGDRFPDGRLWINGALAWPDQNLEFVAYSAPEPTRSKLLALGRLAISDWRWPVLLLDVGLVLTLITLIPVLLVASVRPLLPGFGRFARTG